MHGSVITSNLMKLLFVDVMAQLRKQLCVAGLAKAQVPLRPFIQQGRTCSRSEGSQTNKGTRERPTSTEELNTLNVMITDSVRQLSDQRAVHCCRQTPHAWARVLEPFLA